MAPGTDGRAQSAPAGAKRPKDSTSTSVLKEAKDAAELDRPTSAPYGDDAVLATLKRPSQKKRKPGAKWDGRVAGMTLKEYRERKWSVDACYSRVQRGTPSFSMRPMVPSTYAKRNNNFVAGDVLRSFEHTLRTAPSFSIGVQLFNPPKDRSQGPAEYPFKSTMDPSGHPTVPQNHGARFGSEVLEPRDPSGPAPGDYEVRDSVVMSTTKTTPNFTIQGREAWAPRTTAPGPSMGEYNFEKADRNGKLTPITWNMQGKTDPLNPPLGERQYILPGPDHYQDINTGAKYNGIKKQAPLWKFGGEPRGLRN